MLKWRITSCIVFLVFSTLLEAQEIPTGTWRNHFSYQSAHLLTGNDDVIFCATENGLFSLRDEEISLLSKANGLSSTGASALLYDFPNNVLIVGYEEGTIDLVFENNVVSVNEFVVANLGTSRSINDIIVLDKLAYLATDFGLAVLDLELLEIRQLFRGIGTLGQDIALKGVSILNESLFVTSDEFILIGNLNLNLLDFNNWERIPMMDPVGFTFFDGNLFFAQENTIMSLNPISLEVTEVIDLPSGDLIQSIASDSERIYVLQEQRLSTWNKVQIETIATFTKAADFLVTSEKLWVAEAFLGLLNIAEVDSRSIVPNGPVSDAITHIKFDNGLYAFYDTDGGSLASSSLGYSVFQNGTWSNEEVAEFDNISDVASFDGKIYLSSNGYGLYNLTEDIFVDSPFDGEAIIPSLFTGRDGLFALRYDFTESLYWFQEGVWSSFSVTEVGTNQGISMTISRGGTAWIKNLNNGVAAFNVNDRLSRLINTFDNLPSENVTAITIDREDVVWLGSDAGPVIFTDATFVFDEFDAIVPIFENTPLLEGQKISAIAIDGGNRKWIGTENNGIWVFDDNVNNLDARFTSVDSPLPSNNVIEFAYNGETGEMFILTTSGLTSYQTGTSSGNFRHQNVTIFPNPILSGFQGVVTITGLAEDANIKITDINGRLVDEVDALGGTATWDMLTLQNQPIAGNVYLFFSSTFDGEETFVGKIAVIR